MGKFRKRRQEKKAAKKEVDIQGDFQGPVAPGPGVLQDPQAPAPVVPATPTPTVTEPVASPFADPASTSITATSDEVTQEKSLLEEQFEAFQTDIEGLESGLPDTATLLGDLDQLTEDQIAAEEKRLRDAGKEEEADLLQEQAGEKAGFRKTIIEELGGFLGPSASGATALFSMQQDHDREQAVLKGKINTQVDQAKLALRESSFDEAREIIKEAKATQKLILDSRAKFIDDLQKRVTEQRLQGASLRSKSAIASLVKGGMTDPIDIFSELIAKGFEDIDIDDILDFTDTLDDGKDKGGDKSSNSLRDYILDNPGLSRSEYVEWADKNTKLGDGQTNDIIDETRPSNLDMKDVAKKLKSKLKEQKKFDIDSLESVIKKMKADKFITSDGKKIPLSTEQLQELIDEINKLRGPARKDTDVTA